MNRFIYSIFMRVLCMNFLLANIRTLAKTSQCLTRSKTLNTTSENPFQTLNHIDKFVISKVWILFFNLSSANDNDELTDNLWFCDSRFCVLWYRKLKEILFLKLIFLNVENRTFPHCMVRAEMKIKSWILFSTLYIDLNGLIRMAFAERN